MEFSSLYVNSIRIVFMILTIYYLYKHNFKLAKTTITVFILTFLLYILDNTFNIKVDLLGSTLYYTLIFITLYFGGTLKFYDKYAWWDRMIHFLSGITFVSFGIAISRKIESLDKLKILFFSLTLSITLHAAWEIFEYIIDCKLRTDHQRWQKNHHTNNHKSKTAIQPAGLVDTMSDTIMCIVGTIAACLIWWLIL